VKVRGAIDSNAGMDVHKKKHTSRFHGAALVLVAVGLAGACGTSDLSPEAIEAHQQRMVYGADDFQDAGDVSPSDPWYARVQATASLFRNNRISCSGSTCDLTTFPYETGEVSNSVYKPLCSGERFAGQPSGSFCTGFLVGPDTLVTAAHCTGGGGCPNIQVVFGFTAEEGEPVNTTVSADDVYSCDQILAMRYEASGDLADRLDFAVIKLDRPVTGRMPLALRTSGTLSNGAPVGAVGGYLGLPLKVAGGATVKGTSGSARFEASLDTGPGVSGGPVFNLDTGLVEGILVSGGVLSHQLEIEDGQECARTYPCDEVDGCFVGPDVRDWAMATYIDEVVKVLEGRSCFDNIKNGDETDIDCGGPDCAPCIPGWGCEQDSDCRVFLDCHVPYCGADQKCTYDSEACACNEDSDCDDGIACTTDYCSGYTCWNIGTESCECIFSWDCDDGDPCTVDSCDQYSCTNSPVEGCASCQTNADCGGPKLPICVVPLCDASGICDNDDSACECADDSECDDGNPCTRDLCFVNTRACIHIDECSSGCTEATAVDLGGPGNAVTVPNDGCVRVRDDYPNWWGTQRTMLLQTGSGGSYPVPFSWSNQCAGSSGQGTFNGSWQSQTLSPTNGNCATLIDLNGDGSGNVELRYYGQ